MSRQIYIFRIHFVANSTKSTWIVTKNSSLSKRHCNLLKIVSASNMSERETTYKGYVCGRQSNLTTLVLIVLLGIA